MEWKSSLRWAAIASPIVLLGAFLILPVVTVLLEGLLYGPGTPFIEVISSIVTQSVLNFTIIQALISMVLVVIIGLPGAFLLARLRMRGKSLLRASLIVPFVLPPIVVVVGFLRVFGEFGILDSFLMAMAGTSESILNLANGFVGIILAHTFYNIPLVIVMVSSALERLDPEIEETAEILGATTFQKFRHVILPHIRASLIAASVLTFLFCFMSFPIVLALGEGRYMTLEVRIWYAFRTFDFGEASSLAVIQILITLALAYSYIRLGRIEDSGGRTATIKTMAFDEISLKWKASAVGYLGLIAVLVAGPILAIAQAAVYNPFSNQYTLEGFANLLDSGVGGGLLPLANSLLYAVLATILAVVLGIPLAYLHRTRQRGLPTLASAMTLLPLGVSAITVAYGLMRIIAVPLGLTTNPWVLIVIAQTLIGLPFSARAIELSLRNIDSEVLEQAESLGASRLQRLFYVELPLLAPGILAGGVFAFAMAIGEMSATLFIALEQNTTLAVVIYQYLGVRRMVEAGAAAFVLVAICFIAFLAIGKLSDETSGGAL
ncbi:MAG: ABC transporter permease [Candidatus Thorarchaeota archaeon]|jgi:thiamine transport system permease protein